MLEKQKQFRKTGRVVNRAKRKTLHKRKPPRKQFTRHKLLPKIVYAAIKNSFGNKSVVARRLGCTLNAVTNLLARDNEDQPLGLRRRWRKVIRLFREEEVRLVDKAEEIFVQKGLLNADPVIATKNARWCLERKGKDRGYGKEIILQGGEIPLVETTVIESLPLEFQRLLLELAEGKLPEEKVKRITAVVLEASKAVVPPTQAPTPRLLSRQMLSTGTEGK